MTQIPPVDRSAIASLENTLGNYGLASLADFAWQEHLKGISDDQIMLDIRQTPEYKTRFPAMDTLGKQGLAMTEGAYINQEQTYKQIMQNAGLPQGFYDTPEDFAQMMVNNVSTKELQDRVDAAKIAVYNSDPATLQALHDYYGVNQQAGNPIGDATAYFLDETRAVPAIQKQLLSAQEAGAATRAGYQGLNQGQAERIAGLQDVTSPFQDTTAKFGTLANLQPLFTNLPGEAGAAPTQEQGIAATFEENAAAKTAIANQQATRKAVFQQGGSLEKNQAGGNAA